MAIQRSVRRKLVLGIIAVSFISASCGEKRSVNDNGLANRLEGTDVYEQRCAVCHGLEGDASMSGAKDLTESTLADTDIQSIIENGKNGMPPFGFVVESDSTMTELIEFVKELRK